MCERVTVRSCGRVWCSSPVPPSFKTWNCHKTLQAQAQREAEAQRRQRQWQQDSSSSSSHRSHNRKDRQQKERQRRSQARSPGAEATPKQNKNGRARGACRNPFEGLADSAVMRQFGGGGGLFGGATCSRKSARKKFHELSLLHHPDKAGSNKVMNQSMHMWARAHTHTHTHTHKMLMQCAEPHADMLSCSCLDLYSHFHICVSKDCVQYIDLFA